MNEAQQVKRKAGQEWRHHSGIRGFIEKYQKDNVGMLASVVAWSLLTSLVPIVVGLVAISGLFLRSPSAQQTVVTHLSQALQGALSSKDLQAIVHVSTNHTGLLGLIGFLGVFWGGSNVGGSISTAFQAIFEVQGRSFIKEKLMDVGMIFVFTVLLIIILVGTTAGAMLGKLASGFPIPGGAQFIIGTAISLGAAFLLFASIYSVFPNIQPRLKLANVWRGAILSAILFEILSYVWPIYARFSHFSRYGAVLVPLLILTAWLYFFAMITMIGAEVVAVSAIHEANRTGQEVGPRPQDTVPQHRVLRDSGRERKKA